MQIINVLSKVFEKNANRSLMLAYFGNMEHSMSLNSPWFELVKQGVKKYEGRRNTDKIKRMNVGDAILFRHHTDPSIQPFKARIVGLNPFPTFKHALEYLPIRDVLPIDGITVADGVNIYQQYVSLATQERDGVVLIEVSEPYIRL
jgi:ASC-1-like (ASCH) protein